MFKSGLGGTAGSKVISVPALVAVVLAAWVVVFWQLGAPTFWDPDEAHYAETTRELITTGDWVAPYYNERPFFDKPIFFHWLQAIPMMLLGPTELSARLVPALAAVGLIALTAWVGMALLLSTDVSVMAAALMATSPAVFALARYAILDTVFAFFLFGGAALVSVAAMRDRPRLQWYGYLAIALAVLTKGPVALVLCGLAFGLTVLVSAEARRRLFGLRIVVGTAIVLVAAAPWFLYMGLRFRDAFINTYLLDENLRLYASDMFSPTESSSVWFYVRVLAAGMLPWTGLIAGRLWDDLRAALRRDRSFEPEDVLLWSWTIAIVAFFTISKFKLDHYVFPVAPTLCLIAGRAWAALRDNPTDPRNRGARLGRLSVGPVLLVMAAVLAYVMLSRLGLARMALLVPAAIAAAGVLTVVQLNLKRSGPTIPWAVFGALLVTYAGVVLWVLPVLEQRKVVPDLARWVSARAAAGDRVASYRLNRWIPAFRFYVGRHISMIDSPEVATALFAGREPFYCAMLRPAYDEFVAKGVPLEVVYEREGMWATSGRVLWRRQAPLTSFVIVTRSK